MSTLKFYQALSVISFVYCLRHDVHEMMYRTFDGAPACFRRLNGTHQFGCSSPRGGSYGVIHFINNDTNLNEFLQNAIAGPYAIVLTSSLFKRDVIEALIASDKVSGIVLNAVMMPDHPDRFSPDDDCPNKYTNYDNDCKYKWNPYANKFLFDDWPLPVFLINNEEHYNNIVDCHDRFNPPLDDSQLSRPLCSLHLNSHMYAAVNSETCLRRINYYGVNTAKYCDPLGDENVVLPSIAWSENNITRNVIVVGARMDAMSMFDGISPGAMTAATGLVTFLSTASILHKMLMKSSINDDVATAGAGGGVIFMLFNGEANDYIGSSRIVYDMQQNLFPSRNNKLNLNQIRLFIEMSQLSANEKVYVHHTDGNDINDFINYLSRTTLDVQIVKSQINNLPPTSLQSFLKADKNISAAVLTNYEKEFINRYYNSIFDTSKYLNYSYANGTSIDRSSIYDLQNHLTNISQVLASYLYEKSTLKTPPAIEHQEVVQLVDELLHCFIETRKCRLMNEVGTVASDKVPDPLPLYVGVKNNPENYVARVTGFILAYLTGKQLTFTRENCINEENQKDFAYIWMNGESGHGVCINSSVLFTPAESPAFIIPDYNWKSGKYSTWTESVWGVSSLGMFVKPYRTQEFIILSIGLFVMILSFTTVFWFNKKAQFLFVPVSPTNC